MSRENYFPIRFKFNLNKFLACMASFAEKTENFDTLKAAKLLYYADKHHLIRYGRPIIGDTYKHLDKGPVPSFALDVMNDVVKNRLPYWQESESYKNAFKKIFKVIPKKGHPYPVFQLIKSPNLNYLSESEVEAIRETIKKYGKYTGRQLIKLTHRDASWKKTKPLEEIDYRLFFENEPQAEEAAKEYMEFSAEENEMCRRIGFDD